MYEQVEKKKNDEQKRPETANAASQMRNNHGPTSRFVDNRPEAIQTQKLRELAKTSPQNARLRDLHNLAAAHSVAQKQSNVKQGFGFVDIRPEVIAQRKLQSIENRHSANKTIQKKPGEPVAQLKLPNTGEEPETKGYYEPVSKSQSVAYSGGRPADFSTLFKMRMVENEWGGSYNAVTDMWHVLTSGDSQVVLPTNAIQIDHDVPWDTIEKDLLMVPQTFVPLTQISTFVKKGLITPDEKSYSLYAARKYYHDVPNPKPHGRFRERIKR